MIKFSCPHCSHRIKAQLATAGIRSKCPHCKANITVPMPEYLEPIKHEPEREYPKVAVQEKPSVPVAVPLSGVALKKKQIEEKLESYDWGSKYLGRREIEKLPELLWEDEEFETLIQGVYNNGHGILCATNRRLIFIDKKIFFGIKVEDFSYDKVTSISYETGILFGKITLFAAGNKAEILQTSKSSVKVFVDHIRTKLSDSVRHNSISGKPDETNDRIAALERLSKLKSDGILTEEEFQKEKQSILNQL